MEDHVKRVLVEYTELVDKCDKLGSFFASSTFARLDKERQALLGKQHTQMRFYADTLHKRLLLDNVDPENDVIELDPATVEPTQGGDDKYLRQSAIGYAIQVQGVGQHGVTQVLEAAREFYNFIEKG